MKVYESGSIGTLREALDLFMIQNEILDAISNVPIALLDSTYKNYGMHCYICADGKCVDIQSEN